VESLDGAEPHSRKQPVITVKILTKELQKEKKNIKNVAFLQIKMLIEVLLCYYLCVCLGVSV